MSRTLVVATTNAGKLREVSERLAAVTGLEVRSLSDYPPIPVVEESGSSFRENAARKAVEYSRHLPGVVLADDSGLCVDALGGEPGVASARYGGPGLDDPGRCRLLLERLEGVEEARRGARFECALALAAGGRLIAEFAGRVEGRILTEPRGTNGFGYDPVFFHPPSGRTFAEMTTVEKSAVSHRGRALDALREHLESHPDAAAGGGNPLPVCS